MKVTVVGLTSPRLTHRTFDQGTLTVTWNGWFFSPWYGSVAGAPSVRGARYENVTVTSDGWRLVSPAA